MVGSVPHIVHPQRSAQPSSSPGGGVLLPAGGSARPYGPQRADRGSASGRVSEYMARNERTLHFRVDETSGRTIIQVVNPETHELVREIPLEEMQAISRWLALSIRGLALRTRA
jgi:flagellar protein FlaG